MPQLLCSVRSCHRPLAFGERRVVCERGHSFDIARSGYINLLQPQERRSRKPGDQVDAIAARRRFLDRGHAEPLLNAVRAIAPAGEEILDAGCGEGYYLGSFGRGCGVDISTAAIDLAARRYPQCQWIVANADRFIPYADASFDLVLSITGRMNPSEFRRVLRDDGSLLVAVAAPDDLIELRGRGRDRVARTIETFCDFKLVKRDRVTTVAALDAQDASDILRASYRPGGGQRPSAVLDSRGRLSSTLSLDLLLFSGSGS